MRVTLLGHASVLVELDGATCLMDPVLADPFEEGIVVSCPRRTIDVDRLPAIDLLVVSHRHPDHFDLPSLARVDRRADAVCPADPLIVYALKELGFENVHPVHPMAEIVGEGFELFPTRSELKSIPEMGVVFHDRTGTFWNQVDTPLADATIDAVRERFSRVDLLFAMYASQNFEFFESLTTEFPAETHARNLETALRIDPHVAVPASAGFRFDGAHDWLNAFLFPISRDRFVRDVHELAPEMPTMVMNPGDVMELDGQAVRHLPSASPVARTEVDDSYRVDFDPTAPIPPLCDANADGLPDSELGAAVDDMLTVELGRWAEETGSGDRVLAAYAGSHTRYRIDVVFPDERIRWLRFDFGGDSLRLDTGSAAAPEADQVHRIAASALVGWVRRTRSFFSVRASSRRYGTACRMARKADGVTVDPRPLPDLLMYYVLQVAEGSDVSAKHEVDHQLRELREHTAG